MWHNRFRPFHGMNPHPPPPSPLDYADPSRRAPPRLDGYALASHLIGWAVFGLAVFAMVVWVVPRFEDIFKDFKVRLPEPTTTLLSISRSGVLLPLLLAVALAHSFTAAAWYPRSGRAGRFLYRIVLMLLLAAVVAFFFITLFLPFVTLMSALSGAAPSTAPAPAPGTAAPHAGACLP